MTTMKDSIRILLKAYGEELSLEQINKLLAGKNDKLQAEIKSAIPDLLSEKSIIEVGPQTYKSAVESRPNYFYVFQNKTYYEESREGCLFCSLSPEGKTISHWESISDVSKGDLIFHDVGGSIVAISEAQTEARKSIRPYVIKGWEQDEGRRIDSTYVFLKSQIEPETIKEELYQNQPEKLAPFNKNGKGNEGYLFYFNEACAKLVFEAMLKRK